MILLLETEESRVASVIEYIAHKLGIKTLWARSLDEARNHFDEHRKNLLAAIINLQFCSGSYSPFEHLPTILITGDTPLESKLMIASRDILDYVTDYSPQNLEYILQLLKRIRFTNELKVMVVDDEPLTRSLVKNLLINKRFRIIEAANGREALKLLEQHSDIRLMIVDDRMPVMNGIELVRAIRQEYSKNQLAIIGMTSDRNEHQMVLFLRYGANDCMIKPFRLEEFDARVMQNLQLIEVFHEMAELSRRDFLTNLFNRRYFFEIGTKFFESYKRQSIQIAIAMMDIDHFKDINDRFGHSIGDLVIVNLAKILSKTMRTTDIIARFGGEEFCILSTGVHKQKGIDMFERIRAAIENYPIETDKGTVRFTVSIGVSAVRRSSLEEMINDADQLLYEAKNNGRNRVVYRAE